MPDTTVADVVNSISIAVNNQPLAQDQLRKISHVTVEQNVRLPAAFTITFLDAGAGLSTSDPLHFGLADGNVLPIGAEVTISLGRGPSPQKVFSGEVTDRDIDVVLGEPPRLIVRGYDKAHRLQRGRYSRAFLQMSDDDIVQKIASECGLSANADATSQVFDYVLQNNLTDWEFLHERAARYGYEVYVTGTTLNFVKPKVDGSPTLSSTLWNDLLHIHAHATSVGQVSDVTVRGWDPAQKTAIVGQVTKGAATASAGQPYGTPLAQHFNTAHLSVNRRPVHTQAEADKLAQALADTHAGDSIRVEAEIVGNPAVKAGQMIDLKSLGQRYSGQYYLTAVTHRYGHRGYTTELTVGGHRNGTLLESVNGAFPRDGHSIGGAVIGLVTNNKDPQGWGRVKVKLPYLADNLETDWIRMTTPSSGGNRGFYWLPEVDDEVLIAFEHGDVNFPYVIGSLWNGQDSPPLKNDEVVGGDGKVNKRIVKSRSGHMVTLDDTEGSESITVVDKSGNNTITIDTTSNTITVKAQQDLNFQAQGKVTIKGANISIEADASCEMKGATTKVQGSQVQVNADATCDVKGNSEMTIGGAMVAVKADGICNIKGSLINLN